MIIRYFLKKCILLSSVFLIQTQYLFSHLEKSAITYHLNGGRFGDNLASYAKAKWISYKYDIPLFYKPFNYSNQLVLHGVEKQLKPKQKKSFKKIVTLKNDSTITKYAHYLYISHWHDEVKPDYTDPYFFALLKQLIAPRAIQQNIPLMSDKFTIALHVRTGGDYAKDHGLLPIQPLRFPPLHFYSDQIKKISELTMLPLHVCIFTDDTHPEEIAKTIHEKVSTLDVEFSYRQIGNSHDKNVAQDFFDMMDFDCLIRPVSHYSIWVQRLGNHKIVIYPTHAKKIDKNWCIDEICIENNYQKNLSTSECIY